MTRRISASGLLSGLLGVAAALSIAACGSSSGKLIPLADAGPLQSDFEAVAQAAETGDGDCSATEAAIGTTEQDFNELPTTVDAGLRQTLRQGIDNLRSHALALCAQPLAQATVTSTTAKTTPSTTTSTSATTPATTETTTTPPVTPPTTTPATPGAGGGTQAPGTGEETPAQGGGTGGVEGAGAGTPGVGTEAPTGGTQEPGK
ncbi:MAG TPA: hypothetical protein VK680_09070 [Solirubrobacteraceae bacterium]|nr:hypothetical protein [Solirubrobacteraceae bacterium]